MAFLGTSPVQAQATAKKLLRYRRDFGAFASEQLKLGDTPFKLWPCQVPLMESITRQMNERGFARSVWLKARQVGASSLAQAVVAWRAMLWPHVNALVLADEQERAKSLFEISRSFYDHLDPDIRPAGRYATRRELVFANPSQITRGADPGLRSRIVIESAHKRNIAIGASWQVAHLSECARYRDPNFVMDGVIPAVHRVPGTIVIMESSAEMAGTWFRSFFEASMRGETAFEAVFVPWILQPEYSICPICLKTFPNQCTDPEHDRLGLDKLELSGDERHLVAEFGLTAGHIRWMREKLAEMGNDWDLFRQSYPLTPDECWVTPGAQVFPPEKLRTQRMNLRPPSRRVEIYPGPRMLDHPTGKLWIWDEPQPGRAYDIGVDVAQGQGRDDTSLSDELDSSVACVLERGTNRQVAEWSSKAIDPFELATTLYWLGTYFNTAQIAVETNGIGGGTNNQLAKMGYCLTPDHLVLTEDLRWVPGGDLQIGDRLIGVDEKSLHPRLLRRYRAAEVTGTELRRAEVYRIILSDGTELKATGEHPWLTITNSSSMQYWVETRRLRVGHRLPRFFTPWSTLRTYDAGWMAGILDGEGSAGNYRSGSHLSLSQNPGAVFDRMKDLLRQWGFAPSLGGNARTFQLQVDRKSEIARLLGMLRPTRLLPKVTPAWFGAVRGESHATVERVERLGEREIVGLSTSTGTYVSDGFISHNSNIYIWRYRDEIVPRYSRKTGWETNPKSKPWLVGFSTHELVNDRVTIVSERLLKEMEVFVMKGPREWGAVAGHHDDYIIAWMIALLTSDDETFERYYGLRKDRGLTGENNNTPRIPEPWEADTTFRQIGKQRDDLPWE